MQSPATYRIGKLIRAARESRGLDGDELAELAGVSQSTISRLERGLLPGITFTTADKILAALDLRLHVETVPLWADVDERIDEAARLPLGERILTWPVGFETLVTRLDGIRYLLDGLTAAAVQGAPVLVEELEIAIARDDEEAVGRFVRLMLDIGAHRGDGFEELNPLKEGSDRYTTFAGPVRLRLIDRYEPVVWVDIDPLPPSENQLFSLLDFSAPPPLTRAHLAVVPLAEITTAHRSAARVLERIRQRRGQLGNQPT